jgi:hypothetical protein
MAQSAAFPHTAAHHNLLGARQKQFTFALNEKPQSVRACGSARANHPTIVSLQKSEETKAASSICACTERRSNAAAGAGNNPAALVALISFAPARRRCDQGERDYSH